MPGKHTNIGAKRAREARERWGLPDDAPLPCVVVVAEELAGLPVLVWPLPEGMAGALHPRGAIWVNGHHAPVRMRFTVAHELGHHCCGHGPTAPDSVDDLRSPGTPNEVQANAFAAELLAPRAAVLAMVEGIPTLEDVVAIAQRFGISCLAAKHRLSTLGLAGEARSRQLQRELEEELHKPLYDPPDVGDVLGALQGPVRLPPGMRGSVLRAAVDGALGADDAALAAGVRREALADGLDGVAP